MGAGGGRPRHIRADARYGAALTRGLAEANTDLIILAEPDATFSSADVFKLLAYEGEFDIVCGTRTTRELIWEEANMGWFQTGVDFST